MTTAYDWAGRVGDSWADEWRRTDLSFADLSIHLNAAILAAAPETGKAIDIGCGAGGTSIALAAARPGLKITGVDVAPQLVATARERGADYANLRFLAGDAATIDQSEVDLFFSRHGVMFFDDPVAAFTAFRRAAAPDAALVFSCFRPMALNPWVTETAAAIGAPLSPPPAPGAEPPPGPFAFADPGRVGRILAASGWAGEPRAIDYTYHAGRGEGDGAVDEALALYSRIGPIAQYLSTLDSEVRHSVRDRLRAFLASKANDGAVDFPAAAWIWSCRPAGKGETA